MTPLEIYAEHATKINFVITTDIILRGLLVVISIVLAGSFLIGKILVFLNRDKELDSFFYQKSVKLPPNKLYLLTFLYIVTTALYFTVGRSLLKEYLSVVTESHYDFLDDLRPEIDLLETTLKVKHKN